jgi:hypothetical protein
MVMRALWCAAIAVCFLAGGVRPLHAERTRGDACTLRVAASAHAISTRRTSADIGPVVAPAAPRTLTVRQHVVDVAPQAPLSPAPRLALSPRSSRGPPHA